MSTLFGLHFNVYFFVFFLDLVLLVELFFPRFPVTIFGNKVAMGVGITGDPDLACSSRIFLSVEDAFSDFVMCFANIPLSEQTCSTLY